MFNGIQPAPPVQAPQAGINYSPMDQIGLAFAQLPLLAKLLQGQQNQNNQPVAAAAGLANAPVTNAATPGAAAPAAPTTAGAMTTGAGSPMNFTAPNYAGTGYRGQIPLQPYGQMPQMQTSPLATLMQRLGAGAQNPYANGANPFMQPIGSGFASGLPNPNQNPLQNPSLGG